MTFTHISGGYFKYPPWNDQKPSGKDDSNKDSDDVEDLRNKRRQRKSTYNPWDIIGIVVPPGNSTITITKIEITSTPGDQVPSSPDGSPVSNDDNPTDDTPDEDGLPTLKKRNQRGGVIVDTSRVASSESQPDSVQVSVATSEDETQIKGKLLPHYYSVPSLGMTFNTQNAVDLALWESYKRGGPQAYTVYEYLPDGTINIYEQVVHGSLAQGFKGISKKTVDTIPPIVEEEDQTTDSGNDDYDPVELGNQSGYEQEYISPTDPNVSEDDWTSPDTPSEPEYSVQVTDNALGITYTASFSSQEEKDEFIEMMDERGFTREQPEQQQPEQQQDDSSSSDDDWDIDDSWWDDVEWADDDFWSESGLG